MSGSYEQVGTIGVDAGLCWVGDPCYIMHKEVKETSEATKYDSDKLPDELGKDWGDFCNILSKKEDELPKGMRHGVQYNYDMGHPGLGVVVSTGYGDGEYPVYIRRNSDGRVCEVRVIFIDDQNEFSDDEREEEYEG